ncbi:MAG: hypothetical protein A2X36_16825 [Elusimicrobia bacterium GWA2_69_24]|nr:MAG: hypothetical protein A2X36_16825 [Elusimicrobia bacterium GWA2_69_24]
MEAVLLAAAALPANAREAQKRPPHLGGPHFAVQLRRLKPDELAAAPFDILILDYSRDGSDQKRLTREEVARMRKAGRPRTVLAHLPIAEAQDFRYYWKRSWGDDPPVWLDRGRVRFWEGEWQRLIYGGPDSYLDRILDAGFDGVVLDGVDAYKFFDAQGRKTAPDEMKRFVLGLIRYARQSRGLTGFAVYPQNGEELLADESYLAAVNGILRDGAYFGYEAESRPTPPRVTEKIERFLDLAVKAEKTVFILDFVTKPAKKELAYERAHAQGYLMYCGNRDLDRLVRQPWFPEE